MFVESTSQAGCLFPTEAKHNNICKITIRMKFIRITYFLLPLRPFSYEFLEGMEQTWPDIQGLQAEPGLKMETEVNTAVTIS